LTFTGTERATLAGLLRETIEHDRFPLLPRTYELDGIVTKLLLRETIERNRFLVSPCTHAIN
jgi:hypothetical protein